jgi:hypothetical protein
MADQKISQLSAAAALTGTELVPIVQSAATVATTPAAIKTYTNSAIPNSALANINTSTTDTTAGNISRNGDWGFGSTAFAITDFTSTALNYSQIFRSVSATGGPGVAISGVAAPYDGTPNTNYIGVTGGGTGAARLWAGTKNGATATPTWTEFARLTSPTFTSNLGLGGISSTYLLSIAGSLTGGTTTGGINISSTIQSDVTATAYGILANPTTAATAFTLTTFTGLQIGVALGAGSAVTNAYGVRATSGIGSNATNGYGLASEIASGASKWNLYLSGTAQNYILGNVGIGSGKTVPTCALDVNGLVAQSTANTLTALGTNRTTALVLTAAHNVVTSAAAGTGVSLPDVVGARIWIFNNQGTNAINVYPPNGTATINGGAAGAAVSLAANGKMQYVQVATNVWYTMS